MHETQTHAGTLKRIGGRLSLDFANTVDGHASDHPHEWLTSYADLVAWSQQASILTDHQGQRLLQAAARRPGDAAAVLHRAIVLREALYRILSAVSHGRLPATADLDTLNVECSATLARSRIVLTTAGFTWDWAGAEDALDRMLWPVVYDAADLLTSEELARVGECAGEDCGWLFLDQSRNRSRQWCAMEDCGNRAKARRHYARTRAGRRRET
jgi:predicted RNA-binding Zn ribbon-like protein